jgi:hypothetical protein
MFIESSIKTMLMSAVELRSEIDNLLDKVKDESFLRIVHSMLGTYAHEVEMNHVIGYRVSSGEPILAEEADDEFEAIVTSVKKGNYTSVDDLIAQKSERW